MNPRIPSHVIFSTLLLMGLYACGGGGGGSSSDVEPIVYNGNISPAHITATNANILVADIMANSSNSAIPLSVDINMPVSTRTYSLMDISQILAHSTQRAASRNVTNSVDSVTASRATSITINETINCLNSGTMKLTGDIGGNGTGTLTINFSNCDDDDALTNGIATLQIDAYDQFTDVILDSTLETNTLHFSSARDSITFSGAMRSEVSLFDQRETLTINAVLRDDNTLKLLKAKNLVTILVYDNYMNPTTHTESISGRIYDSVEGYVDITTTAPLIYSDEGLDFPDDGGPLELSGADSTKARLYVQSANKVRIEVDSDGDSVFEEINIYWWIDLTGAPTFELIATVTTPVDATYGIPTSIQIQTGGTNGRLVTYALSYGPSGMVVDQDGTVSWTPSGPMFDEKLAVHFSIIATSNGASAEATGTVIVTDPSHARPLVRTGLRIPGHADGLRIADFDGDGANEILMSDQYKVLSTWIYDQPSNSYIQNWVYPFDLSPGDAIGAIAAHDINGDGHPDMIVAAGTGITILDGVTHNVIGRISDGNNGHFSIAVADLDGNGQNEIIYLGTNESYNSNQMTINIYNATDLGPIWQSPVLDLGTSLAVGNVDNDPALEIVTAKGYVYDGASHVNQWAYGPGFGFVVDIGDLNNDGVEEIVAAVDWTAVRTYSATLKSPLWEIIPSMLDIDALLVTNIDTDTQAEILMGNGQWGNVIAYDGISHAEEWSVDSQDHGVSSIAIGDLDYDNKLEFVWTSGGESLVAAGLNPTISVEWINDNPKQLDGPFVGARWLTTATGQRQAVFASVSTNSGYDGTRLAGIDPVTGEITISSETGSSHNDRVGLDGVDYDGDGIDELFLATDGSFTTYDFGRDLAEWTSAPNIGSGRAITHGDLNSDGYDDLIALTTESYIYAYDVFNSTLIWKSAQFAGYSALDVEAIDLNGDSKLEIVAISSNTLSVYKQDPTYGYVLRDSKSVPWINHLTAGDIDNDDIPDIITGSSDGYAIGRTSTVHVYDGVTLNEKTTYTLTGGVTDLTLAPISDSRRNLLVALSEETYSGYYYGSIDHVMMIDPLTGKEIWRSPEIIGQVQRNSLSFADTNNDGNQELIIGTSQAMYITR